MTSLRRVAEPAVTRRRPDHAGSAPTGASDSFWPACATTSDRSPSPNRSQSPNPPSPESCPPRRPPIAAAPAENASTADDLEPGPRLIIDGTPIPCWTWHDKPELHSGEHHTTGVNLQVACTPTGHPAWPPTRCPAAPTTRGPSPNPASSTAAMTLRAMIRPDVLSHPAHRRQGIRRTGT